jgi:predicted O-linked N-acetylglucosamine transferase (SPINDLY family)
MNASTAHARPASQRLAEQSWQEGRRHFSAGRLREASRCFRRAVQHAPGDALYWLNLARVERERGDGAACEAAARQAFDLDPGDWLYGQFLAERLAGSQAFDAVIQVLDRHAAQVPEASLAADWHLMRGDALVRLGRSVEAITPCMQALVLANAGAASDPKLAQTRRSAAMMLGHAMAREKRHAEAAVCFRMALDSDPLAIGSALYAAHYAAWACEWDQLPEDLSRLDRALAGVKALPPDAPMQDFSPFCLLGLSDDPVLMRWAAEHAGVNRATPRLARQTTAVPRPDGRLRVGLLSSDFHQHATSVLLVQALEHIDRSRFDLYFYNASRDDGSALRRRILATASCVHDVRQWSAERLTGQIRTDQIGVLFDLKGFTSDQRLDVLAQRPAALQVAWLGYPGTSGASGIDYIIGDPVVTPLEHAAHFSEAIAQLPHCYQPNDGERSRPAPWHRADCGLPEDAVVLASFNQSYKTTPDLFAAWCQVLSRVPRAVLWLLVPDPDTQVRLRQAAARLGVEPARLIFAPLLGIESHRARLPQADLILDTYPCSGHTTSSDALWAGVPVLTRLGQSFAARVSASLLHTLGLDDLICPDVATYIDRAVALAADPAALAGLRQRVEAARSGSPLFDGRRFAADLGDLLERMVARQDAGLPPAALGAPSTDR